MKLTIEISSGNAALEDPAETTRILTGLAERIEESASPSALIAGVLRDINGNVVGHYSYDGAS